jgi:hypothetical protein
MNLTQPRRLRPALLALGITMFVPALSAAQGTFQVVDESPIEGPTSPAVHLRLSPEDSLKLSLNLMGRIEVARSGRYWQRARQDVPRMSPPPPPVQVAAPAAAQAPAGSGATVPAGGRPAGWPNWQAIAQCESGGNWSANTGNGFWGGLQFHPQTWFAYGGGPFDGSGPFPYSAGEQIAVAERVLAGQGIGAWPYCGRFG